MYHIIEADKDLVTCSPFEQVDVYPSTPRQRNAAQYPILGHVVLKYAGDLACVGSLWFRAGIPRHVPNTYGSIGAS